MKKILFTIYMLLPTVAFIYGFVTENAVLLAVIMTVAAIVWFLLSQPLLGALARIRISGPEDAGVRAAGNDAGRNLKVFAIAMGASLFILLLWFWAYFPGSYFKDS